MFSVGLIDVESVAFTTTALFSRVVLVAFVCSKSLVFDVRLKKYPFVTSFVNLQIEFKGTTPYPKIAFRWKIFLQKFKRNFLHPIGPFLPPC